MRKGNQRVAVCVDVETDQLYVDNEIRVRLHGVQHFTT